MVLGWCCALLFAAALSLAIMPLQARADDIDDQLAMGDYVEGEVVAAFLADGGQIRAQADAPYAVTPLMSVDAFSADGGLAAQSSDGLVLSSVSSDKLSTEELLRLLADDPNVAYAEPNYRWSIDDAVQGSEVSADALVATEDISCGDLTPLQWGNWVGSDIVKAANTAANPSINVPSFGSSERGANMDKQVVVALLDTGVNYLHPDLINVMYHFTPEQQEALGCWEYGYTAIGMGLHGNVEDKASSAHGHGTHTAGIIGAEWNGVGTSGVASNVKIVGITLADANGNECLADALSGFDFVDRFNEQVSEEERIRVTSNSWSEFATSRSVDAAVRKLGEKWGIVSLFSAGNDGKDNDHFIKHVSTNVDNPYVIIVANTDASDKLDSTSSFGHATVELAAPGTAILSTMPKSKGQYLPDATRSNDPLYVGFDGDDVVSAKVFPLVRDDEHELWEGQVVEGTSPDGVGVLTDEVHAYGANSLRIDLDPNNKGIAQYGRYRDEYDLQFEVDLAGTDIAENIEGTEGLHLGIALACGQGYRGVAAVAVATNLGSETMDASSQIALSGFADYSAVLWDFLDINALVGQAVRVADDKLVIKLRIGLPEGCTTVYVDSIGLGTETAPYGFATGTSMSTPAVSGAAAVYASKGYEGKELASLIQSKVRIPDAGLLPVRTGGVFDFTVEGSPDVPDEGALAPVIDDVTVDGAVVTIVGTNFGSAPGKAELFRYVIGEEDQALAASVVSWSDGTVVVEVEGPIEGILKVVLTNAGGKCDTRNRFVSKRANIYEQDLPFDSSTGEAYAYADGDGEWETSGPLVGLGCKLYYLPALAGADGDENYFRRMRCFDLKTQEWSDLPELPEWLLGVSAVMYDGKIVVEGTNVRVLDSGLPSSIFPEDTPQEERVYVYDPSASAWSSASTEGMQLNQTIANDNGRLVLVGNGIPDAQQPWILNPYPLMAYDLATGAGKAICDLPATYHNPVVATKDGTILIYTSGAGEPSLTRVKDGKAELLDSALPEFMILSEEETNLLPFSVAGNYPCAAVLAPCDEGFILVGPPAKGGPSDTFILRDGSDTFEPYGLRASDDRILSPAACTYRGRLFVIGSAWFEQGQRLFRATKMGVPEYPGDVPCDVGPEPGPTPVPGDRSATSGTSSKRLPKTGDVELPMLALFCAGISAIVIGVKIRRTA